MSVFTRLRAYHLAIGILALAAYLSEDVTALHRVIGYMVASFLALRILLVILRIKILPAPAWLLRRSDHQPKLGFTNPIISKGFIAGIMLTLMMTVASGVLLDESRSAATQTGFFINAAQADDDRKAKRPRGNKVLKEIHEFSANSMLALVGLHVAYLLALRRDHALRMIFVIRRS